MINIDERWLDRPTIALGSAGMVAIDERRRDRAGSDAPIGGSGEIRRDA